jgi:hypothetical protein
MPKLDSNFGAPFHVVTKDSSDVIGVVSSFTSAAEAKEAAASLKAKLDATGNDKTDAYVVEGQPALAAFVEEHNEIPAEVQTDNSGEREAQDAAELAPADAPKSSAKK